MMGSVTRGVGEPQLCFHQSFSSFQVLFIVGWSEWLDARCEGETAFHSIGWCVAAKDDDAVESVTVGSGL